MNFPPVIAIDGPTASGKGTVAMQVAEHLGFHYLDSGALYRLVALASEQENISENDPKKIREVASKMRVQFKGTSIYLDGKDVTGLPSHQLVRLGLAMVPEGRQVFAEQTVEDLGPPRADAERFRIGPGNVPEGQDGRARQALADHARQEREMVVLHQHHRIVGPRLGHDRVGETLVHRDVLLPVRFAEHRPHMRDVAQGPKPFVRKAVVIALLFLGTQPKAPQGVARAVGWHRHMVFGIDGLAVGRELAEADQQANQERHRQCDAERLRQQVDQKVCHGAHRHAFGEELLGALHHRRDGEQEREHTERHEERQHGFADHVTVEGAHHRRR